MVAFNWGGIPLVLFRILVIRASCWAKHRGKDLHAWRPKAYPGRDCRLKQSGMALCGSSLWMSCKEPTPLCFFFPLCTL